jgi:hypothetical protein
MNSILKQLHRLRDRDLQRLSDAIHLELQRRWDAVHAVDDEYDDQPLLSELKVDLATTLRSPAISPRQPSEPRRAA